MAKSSLNSSTNIMDETMFTIMKESDMDVIKVYEENVNTEDSNGVLKFCGNENIRKLPYTHKLSNPKVDTEIVTERDYAYRSIFKKKNVMKRKIQDSNGHEKIETIKAYNLGWLDRMACVYLPGENPEDEQNCRISSGNLDNGVFYTAVPTLRLADHMPMMGYFEVKVDGLQREDYTGLNHSKRKFMRKIR